MSALLRYLISLVLHIAWARMGKGPIPAVKLPRRGPVNLPVIGPWQMMIGLWLVNRLWDRYGHGVKNNLSNHPHPAARVAGSLLPDTPQSDTPAQSASSAQNSPAASPAQPANSPTSASAPPSNSSQPNTASQPNFATRLLSRGNSSRASNSSSSPASHSSSPSDNGARLPAGSVLGALRRNSGSNS
jgi:hypothetical protein